jgi:hypothetical protein
MGVSVCEEDYPTTREKGLAKNPFSQHAQTRKTRKRKKISLNIYYPDK